MSAKTNEHQKRKQSLDRSDRNLTPRQAALDVLSDFWANGSGTVDFPVDPVLIAQRMGARVLRATLEDDVSGLLVKEPQDEAATIYLNAGDAEKRQRFTCAHELGHLRRRGITKGERIGYVDSRDLEARTGRNPEEVWANQFAAELLMPAAAVRALWAQAESPSRLARVFGVSPAAVDVRLTSLGLA
ncbi:ImmA/IrrE family metallo-endopeptidase [Plantibacter sp. PA-3-X8]|uniref:ImmA/IrrE family metallo-endopeptidase n=1 Tax=Plantibacter sp. PA-3-X8 TaxID=2480625 RepID=UPI000F5E4FF9|nr:ImmA/IrrE family metallo-endopeptidase [Plantibacter sp. PA-3-X8]AZH81670.1 ImmA/IrrE family metallo-endopeptidase [Plantibacter sp. PA-3-X8]